MTSQQDSSVSNEINGVSAAHVCAIPELLEAILIQLEPIDILISQRVARSWNKTIHGSKRIRQALFVEPEAVHTAWFAHLVTNWDTYSLELPQSNSFMIGKYAVAQLSGAEISSYQTVPNKHDRIAVKARLNSMLHGRGHFKPMTLDDRVERGEALRLGRTKKNARGYGRQMFLTQPPCKEVLIWIDWGQPKRICNEDGVRFWQVLEITESATPTAYLPHIFMLAKGTIALTEAEEKMVEVELGKKENDDGMVGVRDGVQDSWQVIGQTNNPSQTPATQVIAAVRKWLGW